MCVLGAWARAQWHAVCCLTCALAQHTPPFFSPRSSFFHHIVTLSAHRCCCCCRRRRPRRRAVSALHLFITRSSVSDGHFLSHFHSTLFGRAGHSIKTKTTRPRQPHHKICVSRSSLPPCSLRQHRLRTLYTCRGRTRTRRSRLRRLGVSMSWQHTPHRTLRPAARVHTTSPAVVLSVARRLASAGSRRPTWGRVRPSRRRSRRRQRRRLPLHRRRPSLPLPRLPRLITGTRPQQSRLQQTPPLQHPPLRPRQMAPRRPTRPMDPLLRRPRTTMLPPPPPPILPTPPPPLPPPPRLPPRAGT